jgi:hypothetical protein
VIAAGCATAKTAAFERAQAVLSEQRRRQQFTKSCSDRSKGKNHTEARRKGIMGGSMSFCGVSGLDRSSLMRLLLTALLPVALMIVSASAHAQQGANGMDGADCFTSTAAQRF